MELIDAIILGIIQGLTEFLPVSSSGHLEIGKALLGDNSVPEDSLLFTVVVHFATALSTLVVFRKDVWVIMDGLRQFRWNEQTKFSLKIIISMIPAVFIGLVFEEQLESLFGGNIVLVGFMLWVTALLLYLADRAKDTGKPVSFRNSLVIGVSQAIAMLPGVSRSGATISTSVLLGIDKSRAARFSFLMVVPLILGKIIKDLSSGDLTYEGGQSMVMAAGFLAAFLSGMIACTWMIRLVRNSKLTYFAVYCLIVGSLALVYGLLT